MAGNIKLSDLESYWKDVSDWTTDHKVSDDAVKTELQAIKGMQADIIAALQTTNESLLTTNKKLNNVIGIQLTES